MEYMKRIKLALISISILRIESKLSKLEQKLMKQNDKMENSKYVSNDDVNILKIRRRILDTCSKIMEVSSDCLKIVGYLGVLTK